MLTRLNKVENLEHSHNLSRMLSATFLGLCLHSRSTVKLHLNSTVCNYIHMYIINLLRTYISTHMFMHAYTYSTAAL